MSIHRSITENLIGNGAFPFWQRGISDTLFGSGTLTAIAADRFKLRSSGVNTKNIDIYQITDPPSTLLTNFEALFGHRIDNQTIVGVLAADEFVILQHVLEGYDIQKVVNKKCVLSFWVRCQVTGTFSVSFRHDTPTVRSYVSEYTINSANTWERKEIIINLNDSGDPFTVFDENAGLRVQWAYATGTNSQTASLDQWVTGERYSSTAQPNMLAGGAATRQLDITLVKFNEGMVSGDFKQVGQNYEDELVFCQRYYEKSYDRFIYPGESTAILAQRGMVLTVGISGQSAYFNCPFQVNKRPTPTVRVYSESGAIDKVRNLSTSADINAGYNEISNHGFSAQTVPSSTTAQLYGCAWIADAEF